MVQSDQRGGELDAFPRGEVRLHRLLVEEHLVRSFHPFRRNEMGKLTDVLGGRADRAQREKFRSVSGNDGERYGGKFGQRGRPERPIRAGTGRSVVAAKVERGHQAESVEKGIGHVCVQPPDRCQAKK